MIHGHVYIATSVDGFVARSDHQLDWLMKQDTADEDHGYEEFVARMDGIVMGRGSYETVLSFGDWPYSKPVVVASRSLKEADVPPALRGKVRVSPLEPKELMASLEREGWKHVYVDGGKLVQSFIKEGLVEDMVLTAIPILIGSGIRLFGELDRDIDLALEDVRSFSSGLVQVHYRMSRGG